MNIKEIVKKYWWLILSILFLLVFIIILLVQPKPEDGSGKSIPNTPSTAIELEYLSTQELEGLGTDTSIKAQIISRDPLVYKIINNEEDIVKDTREIDNRP